MSSGVLRCHWLRISRRFGETDACIFRIKQCLTFHESASRNVPARLLKLQTSHSFDASASYTEWCRSPL